MTTEMMTEVKKEDRLAALRIKLLDIRNRLFAASKTDLGQMISDGNSADVFDEIDIAEQFSTAAFRAAATKRYAQLAKVEESLRRMGENTFGVCQDCGEEIPLSRLQCLQMEQE